MKENFIEYYPNGNPKHIISYYENGNPQYKQFYDKKGLDHREDNLPDYQEWYENGFLYVKTFHIHGERHNINGPASLYYHKNGKISWKLYYLKSIYKKLFWANRIKNI